MTSKVNSRGQASFEVILIALFILTVTFFTLNSWISIQDETYAIILTKTYAMDVVNQADDVYILRKIEISNVSPDSISLVVYIDPDFSTQPVLKARIENDLPAKIAANTKYAADKISITVK